MNEELEIVVNDRFDLWSVEVWMRRKNYEGFINYQIVDGKITEVQVDVKLGERSTEDIKPFMVLPKNIFTQFMHAMSRFTSSQGVKTRDEFLIEGQLNASLEHLKDMRKFSEKLLDAFLEKPMETIEVREIKNK